MKKNKFFQNKKKDITAFMVTTLVVLGVGYFCANDQIKTSSLCYHSTITAQVDQKQKGMETNTAHLKEVQNAMKQLEKIDGKKVKLEKKMEKLSARKLLGFLFPFNIAAVHLKIRDVRILQHVFIALAKHSHNRIGKCPVELCSVCHGYFSVEQFRRFSLIRAVRKQPDDRSFT